MTTATFPAAAADTAATTTPDHRAGVRRTWAAGAAAAVISCVVVTAFVAIAEAAGVPMEVAESSAQQPEHIPLLGYASVLLVSALIGLVLATAIGRWAGRPRRTFVITALVLTAVSFAFPATTTAGTATKVVLEITHVIPAALIIPAIAASLPSRRVRRTAG